jgi:hypothetical protein
VDVAGGKARGDAVEPLAHLEIFAHVAFGKAADDGAAMRQHIDEPLARQPPDRLAHRPGADAVSLLKVGDDKALTGQKRAVQNGVAHRLDRRFDHRAGRSGKRDDFLFHGPIIV